jgi:hypothetical protein
MIWWSLATLLAVAAAAFIGYRLGREHGRADTEAHYERVLRIEPLDRTQGAPTNLESPQSRVTRGRMVKKSRWNP